jgi:hypothetical protein
LKSRSGEMSRRQMTLSRVHAHWFRGFPPLLLVNLRKYLDVRYTSTTVHARGFCLTQRWFWISNKEGNHGLNWRNSSRLPSALHSWHLLRGVLHRLVQSPVSLPSHQHH